MRFPAWVTGVIGEPELLLLGRCVVGQVGGQLAGEEACASPWAPGVAGTRKAPGHSTSPLPSGWQTLPHHPPALPSSHFCAATGTGVLLFFSTFVLVEGIPTSWLGQPSSGGHLPSLGVPRGGGITCKGKGACWERTLLLTSSPRKPGGLLNAAWPGFRCRAPPTVTPGLCCPCSQPRVPTFLFDGGPHTHLSILSSQEPPPPGSPPCRAAPLPASTLLLTGQSLRGLPLP